MTSGKLVLVGRITSPFGIKGELKLQSYTHNPFDISAYGDLQTQDGSVISIKILRIAKGSTLIARVENCHTRNDAETYQGKDLYVPRSSLPSLGDEEYYLSDLEGVKIASISCESDVIGHVQSVQNFGAGDFLEILLNSGKLATIPFNKEAVVRIDGNEIIIIDENFLIS